MITESKDIAYRAIAKALTEVKEKYLSALYLLDELRKNDVLSDEALTIIQSTVESPLNDSQRTFIRNRFKTRDEQKIVEACEYISLCADGVPAIPLATIGSIISYCEHGLLKQVASSLPERIGAAHALLALNPLATGGIVGGNQMEHIIKFPHVTRLFAENHESVFMLHQIISERNLSLLSVDDVELLGQLASTPTRSLASGEL